MNIAVTISLDFFPSLFHPLPSCPSLLRSYREGKGKKKRTCSLISVLMAATCARSPSPNSSRPRTPDMAVSRKSCCSMPSSFAESPNLRNHCCRSPSPTPRASAIDHKENERDFNRTSRPMAVRAVSSSSSSKAGGKNFMSPTISAASKAVTASPRRKILAEKNEAAAASSVRSSLSSLPDESPAILEEAPAEREVGVGPLLNQNLWEAGDSLEMCSEQGNGDLEVQNHRVSGALSSPCSLSRSMSTTTAATIASLDADPILPPYDPHTNYLSPRPQFLHYRPNPRIEQYWLDESGLTTAGDGKRLEDSFSSESCDNSDEQNEEEMSSNFQKECKEESVASDEEDTAAIHVAESESKTKSSGTGRSFLKYTFASCLLVSVIACLLVFIGGYPVLSPSVLKLPTGRQAIDHLHISDYISAVNLTEMGRKLGLWSFEAVAYYTSVTTMPRQEFGPIFVANFTSSILEQRLDIIYSGTVPSSEQISEETGREQPFNVPLDYGAESSEMEQTYLKVDAPLEDEAVSNEVDTPFDGDVEILELNVPLGEPRDETLAGRESGDSIHLAKDSEENVVNSEAETGPELHQDMENSSLSEFESLKKTVGDDTNKMEVRGIDENEYEHVVEARQLRNEQQNPHVFAIEHEAVEGQDDSVSVLSASQTQCSSSEETPLASDVEGIPSIHELHVLSAYRNDGKLAIGLFLAILLLAASIMFIIMKQKKPAPSVNELEVPKKKEVLSKSASGSSESYGHARGSPYENTLVDTLLAESGPLEFSSSLRQSTSILQRTTRKNNEEETLSHEKRRLRRDSTVSSSSISYGSFTTYEKLSAKKKGSIDDEVVTPVRRSSRIRSQIASP